VKTASSVTKQTAALTTRVVAEGWRRAGKAFRRGVFALGTPMIGIILAVAGIGTAAHLLPGGGLALRQRRNLAGDAPIAARRQSIRSRTSRSIRPAGGRSPSRRVASPHDRELPAVPRGESRLACTAMAALAQVAELFRAEVRPADSRQTGGYVDLLGERDPTGWRIGQQLMVSRSLPLIYQRLWRPLGGRLLMGLTGPSTAEEHRMALEAMAIEPGDRVLDVACGPGNFTRDFAAAASDGLVVGIDASAPMLATAARETDAENVAYLRADACALPFRDGSFEAVCCFAALYLIENPILALEEAVRVLAPGGRLALLSSCNRAPVPVGPLGAAVRGLTGVRIFERDELTGVLRGHGMVDVEQQVTGLAQFVSGRRPA
jgi:SAM-dependent methyltransferase